MTGVQTCALPIWLFDENLDCFIDLELFMRISKYFSFYHISKPLVVSHWTQNSITTSLAKRIRARHYIMQKYWSEIEGDRWVLSRQYVLLGRNYFDNSSNKEGIKYLLRAIYHSNLKLSYIVYLAWRIFIAGCRFTLGHKALWIKQLAESKYYRSKLSKRTLI